jgi:hypothetical protein
MTHDAEAMEIELGIPKGNASSLQSDFDHSLNLSDIRVMNEGNS